MQVFQNRSNTYTESEVKMFHALGKVNWLAVVAAVGAYLLWGYVWYSFVVKRAYVVALGRGPRTGVLSLVGPLLCLTVTTIASAAMMRAFAITSYTGALEYGLIVGLGYLVPMVVNIAINPLFPRPLLYSLINAPFFLVGSVMVSLILVAIGH